MLRQARAQLRIGVLRQSLAASQLCHRDPFAHCQSTWGGIGLPPDTTEDQQERPITPWVRR